MDGYRPPSATIAYHQPLRDVATMPLFELNKCHNCGPLGVYAADGSGPFDCWVCGRMASRVLPDLPPLQEIHPLTERWAADVLGIWPDGVEFSPDLLTPQDRARIELILLGARRALSDFK